MHVKPLIRRRGLSRQQRRLLAFCDLFLTQNDQMPTGQAIASHFGWASVNAAYEALTALERRGLLERNTLGKMRFTESGRRLLPECYGLEQDKPIDGICEPTNGIADELHTG
jgi:SOS-response transcriptional repressor LexA